MRYMPVPPCVDRRFFHSMFDVESSKNRIFAFFYPFSPENAIVNFKTCSLFFIFIPNNLQLSRTTCHHMPNYAIFTL